MHAWLVRALNRSVKIVDAGRLIGQLSRVVGATSERLTTLDLTSSHLTGTLRCGNRSEAAAAPTPF